MNTATPAPVAAYAALRAGVARSRRESGAAIGEWDVIQHPDMESFAPVYLHVTGAHTDNGTRIISARVIADTGVMLPARILVMLPTDTVVTVWTVSA